MIRDSIEGLFVAQLLYDIYCQRPGLLTFATAAKDSHVNGFVLNVSTASGLHQFYSILARMFISRKRYKFSRRQA